MHGFQQIEKKAALWNRILENRQFQMLAASLAAGVIAGLFTVNIRLSLGLPGHKALFWMIPVIMMRLLGGCRIGTTAGTLGVVLTTFSWGGRLAGGPAGLGLILAAGLLLDTAVNFMEQRKLPNGFCMLLLGITAMFSNLLCMVKRLFVPDGLGLHILFANSDAWFRIGSYAFFGLLSGLLAWVFSSWVRRNQ